MSIAKDLLFFLFFLVLIANYILLYKKMLKERDYFIDTLSHDLRVSTIAQIRGLEILEKENKNELVDEIKKSCNYTFDMINTLLNTYKYEKGDTVLNYETFKLEDSIIANCSNFIPSILEKGLRISYQLNSQVTIQADKKGLEKVFLILLSVAILNADRDSLINIITKNNKEEVEISIIYNGRFLTEEEYNRIYFKNSRFSTVGHGIKMNFCKKIIDFHKGYFSIKKNKSGLNSFSFSIPINKRKRSSFALLSLF